MAANVMSWNMQGAGLEGDPRAKWQKVAERFHNDKALHYAALQESGPIHAFPDEEVQIECLFERAGTHIRYETDNNGKRRKIQVQDNWELNKILWQPRLDDWTGGELHILHLQLHAGRISIAIVSTAASIDYFVSLGQQQGNNSPAGGRPALGAGFNTFNRQTRATTKKFLATTHIVG